MGSGFDTRHIPADRLAFKLASDLKGQTLSFPDAFYIAGTAETVRNPPGFPHALALVPGDGPLPDNGVAALWLIDADCGTATLSDPAFDAYLTERVPITLHAEKLRDLRPFLRRKVQFKLRGYRVEVLR